MAQDRVEAVERALSVLNVFDTPQESFSLAELAEATGYYKSTLLRLLASLERFDYTQRGSDGRWRIGSAPVRLARRHAPSRELAAQVQPWLDELSLELGETASLLEMIDGIVQCRLAARPTTACVTIYCQAINGLRHPPATRARKCQGESWSAVLSSWRTSQPCGWPYPAPTGV